ncbi:hypothetical protein I307_05760 [Cryptococcus deuterogattii 99/473]|uniref:Uncharacterized protein n=2 Tax=Cryptococcus deuterogattii TaxID=1859096 RepID=A0A0D0UTT6_9TREE|nr:hypothetical protein D1P53_006259 [Cryptococcus gattii VGV]KGB80272.1 hypothetical protein CNBG_6110 [Cryptococcus deuterogattii R265]KIR25546.1 hypothetical protein I309_05602 [Cryptococcus deuterogattii LA55]KIR37534.1 hypothetical protein I313_06536 [Cryptococcus deuterogattii Ram5]KIR69826.1 hypothetical protein I310_06391 [Cryptococcus deuterogattii CA1014]KIR89766.1 hypothetical protein I304_06485 [Cryptococcus deuterogattii CBS 10090]KIR96161.1 hypothetical protein L804_06497 [Crypt
MSVTAKAFFISAVAVSATTVWGVHYLQKWEYDNMYQGILKDDARLAAKAAAAAAATQSQSQPVTQPAPTVDPDCTTCVISPPPQLLEAQSAEQRAREREGRKREYEEQKQLAGRLATEQGVREETRRV